MGLVRILLCCVLFLCGDIIFFFFAIVAIVVVVLQNFSITRKINIKHLTLKTKNLTSTQKTRKGRKKISFIPQKEQNFLMVPTIKCQIIIINNKRLHCYKFQFIIFSIYTRKDEG